MSTKKKTRTKNSKDVEGLHESWIANIDTLRLLLPPLMNLLDHNPLLLLSLHPSFDKTLPVPDHKEIGTIWIRIRDQIISQLLFHPQTRIRCIGDGLR